MTTNTNTHARVRISPTCTSRITRRNKGTDFVRTVGKKKTLPRANSSNSDRFYVNISHRWSTNAIETWFALGLLSYVQRTRGSGRVSMNSNSPASATPGTSYNEHKPKTPPPDLPSLLLDSRIIYIGMPVKWYLFLWTSHWDLLQLVPAVTELIVSELLYLQYTDSSKPCYIYINSTGCTRADGEVVGFDTEATAIYDTMKYIGNEVNLTFIKFEIKPEISKRRFILSVLE